jgi:competence protein ComEC
MRDPLILVLLAIAGGILTGKLFTFTAHEAAWPVLAFLVLVAIPSRTRVRSIPIGLALSFSGIFAEAWHRPGSQPEIDASSRETLILEGCVVEPSVLSPDREQFTLELDRDARARVSLSLRDGDTPQRLEYGQHIEIEARVRRPHNYNNPGSFDYAAYLARQKIYWTATMAAGSRARILPSRCGSRFMAIVFAVRVAALDRIERLYENDAYATGMVEATLIGETSRLEKVWTENFRRTGTFHALVISGVHVTVLAGVLLFALRICAVPEIAALAVTAVAAWLYALVSGFSAPVVRAAGGFTLYLIARFFFRRGRVMNLLAAVAIVYLLIDPGAMFDASFQLSFLCVAAIGALAAPIIEMTSGGLALGTRALQEAGVDPHLEPRVAQFRVELRLIAETVSLWLHLPVSWSRAFTAFVSRLALFAFEMALVSTAIQIGLALPMVEYFHRVSFSGLTANLLIVPLLNAVVPLGFIAILTGSHSIAAFAGLLLRWSGKLADWHASIEPNWRVPDPPVWLALGFVIALITLAILARHRIWRWPALALVVTSFVLLVSHSWPPRLEPGILELTAIDVGQGDSLLVVFPQGQTMVVDGGGVLQFGHVRRRSNLDTGEDVVSPYLWNRRIARIDVLVATHAHEDHSGGIGALIENFHPRELWTGASPLPRVVERAARFHVPVIEKRAAPPSQFSGATIEVVSPPSDYAPRSPGNNDSLAFRITYGSRSFLLTGDMEKPMEASLLGQPLHSDVLKVGHHGSKTSTTQPFLDLVSPSFAIISAGFENSFGHPHPDVLARLNARHTTIFRTDLNGLVTVRTDGLRMWSDTMTTRGAFSASIGEHSFDWAFSDIW